LCHNSCDYEVGRNVSVKSRPSVPYGANLSPLTLMDVLVCHERWPQTISQSIGCWSLLLACYGRPCHGLYHSSLSLCGHKKHVIKRCWRIGFLFAWANNYNSRLSHHTYQIDNLCHKQLQRLTY